MRLEGLLDLSSGAVIFLGIFEELLEELLEMVLETRLEVRLDQLLVAMLETVSGELMETSWWMQ
jgi:hypothetical protein